MLGADALEAGEFFEYLSEGFLAVRGQLNGVTNGVHYPAQDDLAGVPTSVALEELLEGYGFVAVWFVSGRFGKDSVNLVQ